MKQFRQDFERGFTLVELLIVVIILALLAAIVVPQFASSTDDAKVSSLDTTLANMRSVIDLYNQQHGEYPGAKSAVPDASCTATTKGVGTGGAGPQGAIAFVEQLAYYTDSDGAACSIKMAGFKYGPYLKKNVLAANPITDSNALEVIDTGDLNMPGTAANLGWKFDLKAGKFIANDTTDPDAGGPLVSYDKH